MAAPIDSSLTRVRTSATEGGTYANVGYVRSVELVRGSEGDTTLRWFGGDGAIAGAQTLEGTMPIWWDDADTAGQEALKAAYESGTAIWLQFCPRGTAATNIVMQFQAYITEVRFSSDAEGDAAQGSFSYRGVPSSYTEPVLA